MNWTQIQNTETSSFAKDVIFKDDRILMSTSEGIYSSVDGGNAWLENNDGISALQIISIIGNDNNLFAGTQGQGVFRSDFSGNWIEINTGLFGSNSYTISEIIIIEDQLIIGTGGGVFTSSNNGDSWMRVFDPGINKSVQSLGFDAGNLAAGVNGSGIYLSTNLGLTWGLAETSGLNIQTSYEDLAVKGDTIVVSTADGEVFISEDFGLSWIERSIAGSFTLTNDLQFNDSKLFAGTSRGLFVSTDLGVNWNLYTNQSKNIQSFVLDGVKVYVAASDGVYVSSESRNIWYDVSDELGNQAVNEFKLYGDKIYAGTFANSVWERLASEANLPPLILGAASEISSPEDSTFSIELTDLIVDDADNSLPEDFTLTILAGSNYTFEDNKITPSQDYFGSLEVRLLVNDGIDDSPVFRFPVQVTPVNDAPIITDQSNSLTIPENTALTIELEDLTVEDVDNAYPTDFILIIKEGENYTYENNVITPAQDYVGTLLIQTMVNDGMDSSNVFAITVEVTYVNKAPIIISQFNDLSTSENAAITIELEDLLVEDVDNDYPADFTLVIVGADNYSISENMVTPNEGFIGVLSVPVMVNDGELNSEEFLISIEVTEREILSLESNFIKQNFIIYPNPVKNRLNISSNQLNQDFQIYLYSLQGRLIFTAKSTLGKIETNEIMELPDGLYLLQISSGNKIGSFKLMKE